ncbi:hypothetical protein OCU04_003041 [Sclerotinia nivalis]|uniref:Uncharacterized protein n=1 Tax=Sclerotinia nivalis TaxID=352851 RepID=A0A9X0AUV6_9HELO|nr:hypothetical protein OCU04_003041 [Sclerotinia nivalis]
MAIEEEIPKNTNPRECPTFSAPGFVVTLVAVGVDDSARAIAISRSVVVMLVQREVIEDVEVVNLVAVVALEVVLSIASPHRCNLFHPSANSISHQCPIQTSQ